MDKALRYAQKHYRNAIDMTSNLIDRVTMYNPSEDNEVSLMNFAEYIRNNIDEVYINSEGKERRYKDHKKHTMDFLEISWRSDWLEDDPKLPIFMILPSEDTGNNFIFKLMLEEGIRNWDNYVRDGVSEGMIYLAYNNTLLTVRVDPTVGRFKVSYHCWYGMRKGE